MGSLRFSDGVKLLIDNELLESIYDQIDSQHGNRAYQSQLIGQASRGVLGPFTSVISLDGGPYLCVRVQSLWEDSTRLQLQLVASIEACRPDW